jgi:hypothetical protein
MTLRSFLPYSERPETTEQLVEQNYFASPKAPSFLELAGKQFTSQVLESPTALAMEALLPSQQQISAQELNSKYGVNLFTAPTTQRSADFIYRKYIRDQELEGLYELANAGPIKRLGSQLVGGFGAFMADPINLGLLATSNVAMSSLYRSSHLVKGISDILGKDISTNIVEDLATSLGSYAVRKGMEDFTKEDPSLMGELATSAVFNSALYGLGKLSPKLGNLNPTTSKQASDLKYAPDSVREKIITTEMWNDVMDAPNKKFKPKRNVFDEVYENVSKNVDFTNPNKGVWAAFSEDAVGLANRVIHAGPRFGNGLVLHSNPQFPVGFAEHFNTNAKLYNFELQIDKMNLLNLAEAKTVPKGKFEFLKIEAEKRLGLKIKQDNLAEVFNYIENNTSVAKAKEMDMYFSYANKKLEEMGYQGYKYNIANNSEMYKMFQGVEKELEYNLDKFSPMDIKAPESDFGVDVNPFDNDQLNFLHGGGLDPYVPALIEGLDLQSSKQLNMLPMYMSKQQLMQSPQGWLSNGKRIKMDDQGRVFVTDLMSTDTEFQMGYTEIFSKEHIDRIQQLVNKNRMAQVTKEFPDIGPRTKETLKTIEEYKLYDAQEIAYQNAEEFFTGDWYNKSDKEIFKNLDTLGKLVDPEDTENFLKDVEDFKLLQEEKVKFEEEFTKRLIEEDNKIFKETARSILKDTEMKRLQEVRDVKGMYEFLKNYVAKDAEYTKGVQSKSLQQLEKLAEKTAKLEQKVFEKGDKLASIAKMADLKEGSAHYEALMKPFKDFVEELKSKNPDMKEVIIKAAEVCLRRNS